MNTSKRFRLVGVSMILAIGMAACNKQSAEDKMDSATGNIRGHSDLNEQSHTVGEVIDDSAITTKVKAAILAESGLKVLQIDVATMNGVTTLSGSVDSQQNSDKAKEVTAAVAGVKTVENQLVVKSTK